MLALAIVLAQTCEPTGEFLCRSGDQSYGGIKTTSSLAQFMASYSVGPAYVGVYSPSGVATRAVVAPYAGDGVALVGRRFNSDPGAHVIIDGDGPRGAYQLAVNVCGAMGFGFTDTGDFHFGQGRTLQCASDPAAGSLVDISGASGHVALRCSNPGCYLPLRGAEGANVSAVNADGSQPVCDGGRWTFAYDGGCRYHAASGHGSVDLGDGYPRWQGQIAEFYNPRSTTGARTDHVAYVSANGGFWQNHGLTRATFPPPGTTLETNQGTFFVDAAPMETLCDRTPGNAHCYFMRPGDDAGWVQGHGAGWVQWAEQPDVDALAAEIELIKQRLAALEAACP